MTQAPTTSDLLIAGTDAATEILSRYYLVEKALNPLKYHDYLAIVGRLSKALVGVTAREEGTAIKRALEKLDVDWPNMNEEQIDRTVDAARSVLRFPESTVPELTTVLNTSGKRVIVGTKEASAKRYKLRVPSNLNDVDANVLKSATNMNVNYIRDAWGVRQDMFDQQARQIVADGLAAGNGREEIGEQLFKQFGGAFGRSEGYYDVVASAHAGRSRAYAHLSTIELGGFEEFEFVAVMDEVTSSVCRFMNGRRFKVKDTLDRYTSAADLEDPEEVKDHQPWLAVGTADNGDRQLYYKLSDGSKNIVADITKDGEGNRDDPGSFNQKMSDSDLLAAGVSSPPLHGRCRSTIVAV